MEVTLEQYVICPIHDCGQRNYSKLPRISPSESYPPLHCSHWVAITEHPDWPKLFALVDSQTWNSLKEARKEEIRRWIIRSCEGAGLMLFHKNGIKDLEDSLARSLI